VTTTIAPLRPRNPVAPKAKRPKRKRSWRWLRLVTPFLVVLAILVAALVVHSLDQPDPSDPAYLNPDSAAPLGGQHLADLVRQQGVTVERVTKSSDALVRAYEGDDVTLFVPAPSLMHPYYLRMLKLLPATTRVVLVEPSILTLGDGHVPVADSTDRWAPKAVPPGCDLPEARRAGVAGVYHKRYGEVDGAVLARCYDSAVVSFRYALAEVVLVGSSDPFRNDRIGEYGNAALAAGLLTTRRTVVWLDLHRSEPPPGIVRPSPGAAGQPSDERGNLPAAPPSLGTDGSPDPDFPVADPNGSHRGDPGPGPPLDSGDGGDGGAPSAPPVWKLLPLWAWTGLGLLFLAAVLYALAQARRLGPPVSEPLPVAVRASETVEGRGRLYRRAKARDSALDTLRTFALQRLRPALGLPPEASLAEVVASVVARTGRPADEVDAILAGATPADDAELVALAHQLDDLVRTFIEMSGEPR
jgi:hypothetical protein